MDLTSTKNKNILSTLLVVMLKKKVLLLQEEEALRKKIIETERSHLARKQLYRNFQSFCETTVTSDTESKTHFFVSKNVVMAMVDALGKKRRRHNFKFSLAEQVVVFLEFVTGGESYCRLSRRLGISKCMVSIMVSNVAKSVNDHVKSIKIPESIDEWRKVENTFVRRGVLRTLGALDGKHIRIRAPPFSGSLFYNYKSFFSFVLLALVDGDGRILWIDVGAPGSTNDATIFNRSSLKAIIENSENIPKPIYLDDITPMSSFIVGDGIFPISTTLMKPFDRRGLTQRFELLRG